MKKERVIASKNMKTITKPKTVISLGEDLLIFSAVSNVYLDNLILSKTANINDFLAPLTQQITKLRYFLNLHPKCMDRKLNFNNYLSDITCDIDLVVENDILKVKLEEADKKIHSYRVKLKT